MSIIIERFKKIKANIDEIKPKKSVKIVAISKTFDLNHIKPLIDHGHDHFGENKVQEAFAKWKEIKNLHQNLKLHMVGKLQSLAESSVHELCCEHWVSFEGDTNPPLNLLPLRPVFNFERVIAPVTKLKIFL